MDIRRATVDDAPILSRVHVDSWRAAYREFVPQTSLDAFTYKWREQCYREALASGAEETYIVQVGDEAVGYLTLGSARDPDLDTSRIGEIWGIYIVPEFWRQGIGTRLAKEGEHILRARGYERIVLWVLEDNQQARRFYEAMGFLPDGRSKEIDWGTLLTAVRYSKALKVNESGA